MRSVIVTLSLLCEKSFSTTTFVKILNIICFALFDVFIIYTLGNAPQKHFKIDIYWCKSWKSHKKNFNFVTSLLPSVSFPRIKEPGWLEWCANFHRTEQFLGVLINQTSCSKSEMRARFFINYCFIKQVKKNIFMTFVGKKLSPTLLKWEHFYKIIRIYLKILDLNYQYTQIDYSADVFSATVTQQLIQTFHKSQIHAKLPREHS